MSDKRLPDDTPREAAPYSDPRAFEAPPDTSWGKLLQLVPEGSRVLDVGCSFGGLASAMRRLRAARVVGVEIDPVAARAAREHCDEVIEGDIGALGDRLPSDFDVVVAADVLEHLVDPPAALRTLAKRLRPGGILLASIPNVTHTSVVLALAGGRFPRSREGLLDFTHLRFFGEADVLDLFHGAGFAARVADHVRIDPRLTEFKSDLLGLPEAVLEFLGRNPSGDTYQFIVRAVPRAWSVEGDDQDGPEALGTSGAAGSIRHQLDELHAKLREYHEALNAAREAAAPLHEQLRKYHESLTGALDQLRAKEIELERTGADLATVQLRLREGDDAREIVSSKQSARRARALGALPQQDLARLRVLYIADRDDAPYRYRCVNACEQLRNAGAVANVARLDEPGLADVLQGYSVIVLFRLCWSPAVEKIVEAARKSGATVGLDVDDLVFDPEVERWMPFLRRFSPQKQGEYRRDFRSLGETLAQVDFCVGATPTIARHARSMGKRSLWHPNLLPAEYVNLSRAILPLRRGMLRDPLFAYLSGSNTHDGDLESIAPVVADVLAERSSARFVICGHASLPAALGPVQDRVFRIPYQHYRAYPWLFARCSAALAPIEEVNEFSNAKSALKVFEAGVFGVPTVASPTVQYREAIQDGVSGFIASSAVEQRAALLHLCDRTESLAMGAHARRISLEEYSQDAYRHVLARQLMPLAGKVAWPPPALRPIHGSGNARDAVRLGRVSLRLGVGSLRKISKTMQGAREVVATTGRDADAALAWIAGIRRNDRKLEVAGQPVAEILADREHPLGSWRREGATPVASPSPGTRFEATTDDPLFVLDWRSSPQRPPQWLLLEMRASTSSRTAAAQIFWRRRGRFSEARSIRFSVAADGVSHACLVPLSDLPPSIDGVRFDPLDSRGEFEVLLLALLFEQPPAQPPAMRRALAARFLQGEGIEIGALHDPLSVPAEARVRYVDRLATEDLRKHYPELQGANLVEPSILASADDLASIGSGTQRFVICNHVLEHMRDPLRAIREWLRVLAPGGCLYLSIPDRANPHDRLRPVTTFQHLIDDARGGGRKGTEVDRAAFFEWAQSAHAKDMTPEQRDEHARQLIGMDYSIHFHVFDRNLFEQVLQRTCLEHGGRLVEFQEAPLEDYREFIAVVRKESERADGRGIDVVIPVYNARELTRQCVESVLRHMSGDVRLVLVNDASTEPGVAEDLRAIASRDARVVVLTNEKNVGFVATANRGMRHAADRDVLLLNSDTEVFPGFIEQLRDAAYCDEQTGIVTPFSNNATIYSIPEFGEQPIPQGHTAASVAAVVTATSRRVRPEMPTAVGFCMYVRFRVREKIGYFDEESFGRGFGEENDFCQRARKAGFKVRLCDDAFVWHKGKASFGEKGRELERRNEEILRRKHPEYHAEIARFCRTNPLSPLHRELKFHLSRLREGARGAALFLIHASPFAPAAGGTEHHVLELLRTLELRRAVLAYPDRNELIAAEIIDGRVDRPSFFRFPLGHAPDRFAIEDEEVEATLRHWVDLFGLRWAHLHHLMSWPLSVPRVLREAGVPYIATVHDYYPVCPDWNLFDFGRQQRCPCPDPAKDAPGCVPDFLEHSRFTLAAGVTPGDLRRAHRAAWIDALGHAQAVLAPSQSAREVLLRHLPLPEARVEVVPHGYDVHVAAARKPPGAALRVALLGEIAYPLKGSRRYLELIAATRHLDIEWHVFGNVELFNFDQALARLGLGDRLQLHGRYERSEIVDRLAAEGIDLCVLLPEWDETFSYTLSEALLSGAAVIVSDRGALAERVRRTGTGFIIESTPEAVGELERLCADRSSLEPVLERVRSVRHRTLAENAAHHRRIYASTGFAFELEAEVRPEWIRELTEHAEALGAGQAAAPAASAPEWRNRIEPVLKRLRPFIPRGLRRIGKQALLKLESKPRLVLESNMAACTGLRVIANSRKSMRLEAQTGDPQMVFAVQPFPTAGVNELRFRLRREQGGLAHAQLFWATDEEPEFSEARSAMVALDGPAGEWREYRVRLDAPDLAQQWQCGAVARLRFDPIDRPGDLELSRIEFYA